MNKLKAAYSGVPGSYAEEAALDFFSGEAELVTASSFENACKKLAAGAADRAVLPLENSSTGAISAVYDLLAEYGFWIVGEQYVRVNHCLMALPGTRIEEIEEVVSHEQGLSQSAEFLEKYSSWKKRPVYNTAAAAQMVAESKGHAMAAIASRRAAECYGLEVLVPQTNFKAENFTRFVIVSQKPQFAPGSNKLSVLFTLPHKVGSLRRVLQVFEDYGMNLVKIESRPMADKNWEYLFFVDFVTEKEQEELKPLMNALTECTQMFRFFGYYLHKEQKGSE